MWAHELPGPEVGSVLLAQSGLSELGALYHKAVVLLLSHGECGWPIFCISSSDNCPQGIVLLMMCLEGPSRHMICCCILWSCHADDMRGSVGLILNKPSSLTLSDAPSLTTDLTGE